MEIKRIIDEEERKFFLNWLDHMEHGVFKIPRPDMIIYLDVPLHITQRLLKEKKALDKKAEYHKGTDQHEDNLEHLQNAKESGLKMVAALNTWARVECYENDAMLPIPVIHNQIWNLVSPIIKWYYKYNYMAIGITGSLFLYSKTLRKFAYYDFVSIVDILGDFRL